MSLERQEGPPQNEESHPGMGGSSEDNKPDGADRHANGATLDQKAQAFVGRWTGFVEGEKPAADLYPLDAPMTYTMFANNKGADMHRRATTWGKLVEQVRNPAKIYPSKAATPFIKLAEFGNKKSDRGSYKTGDNMGMAYGIEVDYDAGVVSPAEAAARMQAAGVEGVVCTTSSHTPEDPHWRAFCPLARPCAWADARVLVGVLNAMLGGILAVESFATAQGYHVGRVEGVEYETHHARGIAIDDDLFYSPAYPAGKEPRPVAVRRDENDPPEVLSQETIEDLERAVQRLSPDRFGSSDGVHDRHVAVLRPLKHAHWCGWTGAYEAWLDLNNQHGTPRKKADAAKEWARHPLPHSVTYRSLFGLADEDNPPTAEGFEEEQVADAAPYDHYDDLGDHSDTGNANLLRKFAGGNMRFVVERNCWMWWNDEHWQVDDTGALAQKLALRVGKFYLGKAQAMERRAKDESLEAAEQKKLSKVSDALKSWATTCRNKTALANMLVIASRDSRMVIRTADLDRDPWLFGVANGVVDLRTGALRAAARDDFVTKRSAVAFRPGAAAARWRIFNDEITGFPNGDGPVGAYVKRPKLAAYLQRMCGYLMTGITVEHKMFIFHGKGANGKNILLDTVQEVMGTAYCVTVPPEALMATRHDGDAEKPSSVAATLAGARAAISSESKEGQKLDVALVKRHTGGGFMNARLMRENSFQFLMTHKLGLMTNHRPPCDHMDEAIRGRLHMIPFDRVWNRPGHPDRDPALPDGDKDLMDALRAESEGVLAWLVEGAVLYHQGDLEPPEEVTKATRDYFATEDSFGRWLESMEPCEPKAGMRASDLFNNFNSHCIDHALRPSIATQTAFSLELKKRGVSSVIATKGTFYGLTYGGLVGSGGLF